MPSTSSAVACSASRRTSLSTSSDPPPDPVTSAAVARQLAAAYPYIGELALAVSHEDGLGPCDDDVEFLFALDLILDGLERRYAASIQTQ